MNKVGQRRTPQQVWVRMTPADRAEILVPCWTANQFMPDGNVNCTLHFYDAIREGLPRRPSFNCRTEWLCESIAADLLVPWHNLLQHWGDGDIDRLAELYQVEPFVIRFQLAKYGMEANQ